MKLRIRSRDLGADADSRRRIERAVRVLIGRHAAGIDGAELRLSPLRQPGPGGAWRCGLRARLRRGAAVAVEAHADEPEAAVREAALRLERRLDRGLSHLVPEADAGASSSPASHRGL